MTVCLIQSDPQNHQQNLRFCGRLVHGYDVREMF